MRAPLEKAECSRLPLAKLKRGPDMRFRRNALFGNPIKEDLERDTDADLFTCAVLSGGSQKHLYTHLSL